MKLSLSGSEGSFVGDILSMHVGSQDGILDNLPTDVAVYEVSVVSTSEFFR